MQSEIRNANRKPQTENRKLKTEKLLAFAPLNTKYHNKAKIDKIYLKLQKFGIEILKTENQIHFGLVSLAKFRKPKFRWTTLYSV